MNLNKHGLSFDEAKAVFCDPLARIFPDEWHSQDEGREIIIALDAEVAAYLRARAQAKGVDLDTLVNEMLHREIALIEAVK